MKKQNYSVDTISWVKSLCRYGEDESSVIHIYTYTRELTHSINNFEEQSWIWWLKKASGLFSVYEHCILTFIQGILSVHIILLFNGLWVHEFWSKLKVQCVSAFHFWTWGQGCIQVAWNLLAQNWMSSNNNGGKCIAWLSELAQYCVRCHELPYVYKYIRLWMYMYCTMVFNWATDSSKLPVSLHILGEWGAFQITSSSHISSDLNWALHPLRQQGTKTQTPSEDFKHL